MDFCRNPNVANPCQTPTLEVSGKITQGPVAFPRSVAQTALVDGEELGDDCALLVCTII